MVDRGSLWIRNAAIVTPTGKIEGDCIVREGMITKVGRITEEDDTQGYPVIDAQGDLLCPGFIDLHVHGGGGYDFSDATPEGRAEIVRFHSSMGQHPS